MSNIVILGAGMAGYGAAKKFKDSNVDALIFEKENHYGGHCSSYIFENKWVFDDGPHISFTKHDKVKNLFAQNVNHDFHEFKAKVNNYWKGKWITHPAQVNLHGLPAEFNTQILKEMIETSQKEHNSIANYEQWLYASFGKTFAENFPMKYTRKFHTTEAKNLTTDWLGPRLYQPKLEEVIYGMLSPSPSDVHYVKGFRYPNKGGFVSFMKGIENTFEINYNSELVKINLKNKEMTFSDGRKINYNYAFSSLPLNKIALMMEDAPKEVIAAAKQLAWTQCVVVSLGINRPNITDHHWTYFYDEDFQISRISAQSLFSPHTVPTGCSSLQAEIYFSDKYKPLTKSPEEFIPIVQNELIKCGILRMNDEILVANARVSPFAQIIFDHDRKSAVELLHSFLLENNILFGGRYADWEYTWSDDAFLAGEASAEKILMKL